MLRLIAPLVMLTALFWLFAHWLHGRERTATLDVAKGIFIALGAAGLLLLIISLVFLLVEYFR